MNDDSYLKTFEPSDDRKAERAEYLKSISYPVAVLSRPIVNDWFAGTVRVVSSQEVLFAVMFQFLKNDFKLWEDYSTYPASFEEYFERHFGGKFEDFKEFTGAGLDEDFVRRIRADYNRHSSRADRWKRIRDYLDAGVADELATHIFREIYGASSGRKPTLLSVEQ